MLLAAANRTLCAIVGAAFLASLVPACSSAPPKPPPKMVAKTLEMTVDGEPDEVVPKILAYLRGSPFFEGATRDGDRVTAGLRDVPGLGLVVPVGECFLDVDVQKAEGTCKVIFAMYRLKRQMDSLVAEAVIGLLKQTVAGMIKSGIRLR